MNNRELLFFCSTCKKQNNSELDNRQCDIPYVRKSYKRGEYIGFHGDAVNHLMMLTKGTVRTEIVSSTGVALPMENIKATSPLAPGFLFAENNQLPVDIIATDECEVLFITKANVEKQMVQCTGFLQGFLSFTANRMNYMSQRLKIFAQKGIKAKIVYYILMREKNGEFDMGKSITALADYFAVERPSLSRAISEMVKDGIITYDNGKGKIVNTKKLEDLIY